MHYRRLGSAGIKVSEISLGAWITFGDQIDEKVAVNLVQAAYDQGVNFFDNADVYAAGRAETMMGKAIKDLPREALVISSKVFWPTMPGINGRGLSRKHITESIHASLKRLNCDYVDIYYCHRFDPDTSVEEVVQTMDILVRQGKVLYWGTSEWQATQVVQAYEYARRNGLVALSVEQPQYNLFRRERVEIELAPLCKEYGLGLTTFSPLYVGILTGKYDEGIPKDSRATLEDMAWIKDRLTPENLAKVRRFSTIAKEMGLTSAQLAIAWILRRKDVSSVISGATRLEQLDENLAAVEVVEQLDEHILARIDEIFPVPQE